MFQYTNKEKEEVTRRAKEIIAKIVDKVDYIEGTGSVVNFKKAYGVTIGSVALDYFERLIRAEQAVVRLQGHITEARKHISSAQEVLR